jgi:hypothetical protein
MSTNSQPLLSEVISFWQKEGVRVNAGLTGLQIEALEQSLSVLFKPDFKEYLSAVNGFEDFDSDNALFSFWSADRMREELGTYHPEELVCFADHCINLCSFGYHREKEGIYIHYQHMEGLSLVANSFTEFIRIYLVDSMDLLLDI